VIKQTATDPELAKCLVGVLAPGDVDREAALTYSIKEAVARLRDRRSLKPTTACPTSSITDWSGPDHPR
jgi:hypothetical protein